MTDQTWPPEGYLIVSGIPSYRKDGANGPYVSVLCADRNVMPERAGQSDHGGARPLSIVSGRPLCSRLPWGLACHRTRKHASPY